MYGPSKNVLNIQIKEANNIAAGTAGLSLKILKIGKQSEAHGTKAVYPIYRPSQWDMRTYPLDVNITKTVVALSVDLLANHLYGYLPIFYHGRNSNNIDAFNYYKDKSGIPNLYFIPGAAVGGFFLPKLLSMNCLLLLI